jgi:hypothetical protein
MIDLFVAFLQLLGWAWEVDDRRPQRVFLVICFVLIALLMAVPMLWWLW